MNVSYFSFLSFFLSFFLFFFFFFFFCFSGTPPQFAKSEHFWIFVRETGVKPLLNPQIINQSTVIILSNPTRFKWISGLEAHSVHFRFGKEILDRVALAKQGDNGIGSVRPSVRPSVSQRSTTITSLR